MRNYTSIPALRVFAWSSDNSNPVSAEYIIMEKAAGVPLFEQWGKMAEIDKLKLRKNLTGLEAQLAAIRLPVYGGLYLRADVNRFQRQGLSRSIDLFNLFCIGPSCDRSFSADSAVDVSTQSGDLDQGPCRYPRLCHVLRLMIAREIRYQISGYQCNASAISDSTARMFDRDFPELVYFGLHWSISLFIQW